ncbi:MAG: ABC transporter ATP-binding protein [Anaerolineaceae bacterium]|jgi:branched-chain amino acid transport system ATP-binding protein|nr:ABC transporter ATP-binding protein [Anaerolineaceae bacterium]
MSNILEVKGIHTYINQYHILQGVDVDVPEGAITALLGRNGAGKTTTLKSILGLAAVRQGQILFNNRPVQGMQPFDVAALGIGFVPEHRAIFRDLTVEENLKLAERTKGDFTRKKEFLYNLFPDLSKFMNISGTALSGGQQQMLAIARALVPDNTLLLIDEPSEGLAPVIIERMIAVIRELSKQSTVVLVEQNFLVASKLAEYYVIIEEGRSVKNGLMKDLIEDKAAIHRYLGAA